MAVPTFTSTDPATIHTGGQCLVNIIGTGFRVPPLPPPNLGQIADPVGPGVEVLFGDAASALVMVLSETRLLVRAPPSPIDVVKANDYGEGSVSITIRNLDDDGVPIPGEEVIAPDALTYQRAQLATETDLTRLVRTLIRMLRRETIANVSHSTHTDFDADPSDLLNITELAELPGIAILGPTLNENRFYSTNVNPSADDPLWAGERNVWRVPYTVDVNFTIVGVTDQKQEMLNLLPLVTQFFERNPFIYLQRDPDDASAGSVRYEMDFTADGDLRDVSAPNESNLRAFSGTFVIRGFDVEGVAGFQTDTVHSKTAYTDDEGVRLESEALVDPA